MLCGKLEVKKARILGVNIMYKNARVKPSEKVSSKEGITNPNEESVNS